MPSQAVLSVVGAYVVIASLLLSLNVASLWRWPVKAMAIVITTGLFVGSYMAINALIGWPSADRLPDRASFLASRIVEPDAFTGAPGVIYVWLQTIDEQNLPIGEPRAYKMPYRRAVATDVVEAQRMRGQGREVLASFSYGEQAASEDPQPTTRPPPEQNTDSKDGPDKPGSVVDTFNLSQDLHAVFTEMPLVLPDKGPYVREDNY